MILEKFHNLVERTKEAILWKQPESVGTTRITTIQHSSSRSDMCFFACGNEDITGSEFVFSPSGRFKVGDVVEVILQKKHTLDVSNHIFPSCRVALRLFNPSMLGKISHQDIKDLEVMFIHPSNEKTPFFSRAFYRKFIAGAKEAMTAFPDPS